MTLPKGENDNNVCFYFFVCFTIDLNGSGILHHGSAVGSLDSDRNFSSFREMSQEATLQSQRWLCEKKKHKNHKSGEWIFVASHMFSNYRLWKIISVTIFNLNKYKIILCNIKQHQVSVLIISI